MPISPEEARQRNREAVKRYQEKHREEINARQNARNALTPGKHRAAFQKWRLENPDKVKAQWQRWYSENKAHRFKYQKEYLKSHPEKAKQMSKRKYWKHREKNLAANQEWRQNNLAYAKEADRQYTLRNRKRITEHQCIYMAARRRSDPVFALTQNCRGRVWSALMKYKLTKSKRTFELIGCTPQFMRDFLEAQFVRGMTWENYGTFWEIDHIIPLASFDLADTEAQERAFHYSNCRPLEKLENCLKQDSMPGPHQALLI